MADPVESAPAAAPAGPAAVPAGPAAAPAGPAAAPADPLAAFQAALAAHDSAAAVAAWNGMQAKQKKSWKRTDKAGQILDDIGSSGLLMMKEAGAKFSQSTTLGAKVLAAVTPEAWLPDLRAQGMLTDFASAGPSRAAMDDAQALANKKLIGGAAGDAETRALFDKAYPSLHDRSYGRTWLWTRAWVEADIKRMVNAIAGVLPHQHIQTVTGGFYIGTHIKEGTAAKTVLGYAFYHGGRVVMPSGSTRTGGTDGHDMVLGGRVHEDPLNPSGLAGMTNHFDGSALHEVGHGVGAHSDGDSWALALPYTNWKKESKATMESKLWDNVAATNAVAALPAANKLAPTAARTALMGFIKSKKYTLPRGWKQADTVAFIDAHYADQKLTKYAKSRAVADDYKFSQGSNIVDGRVYVFLSRWSDSFASYTERAYNDKTSWYSVSSPLEWFAEQYSAYYQFGPENNIQQPAVKDKFKALHNMKMKKGKLKAAGAAPHEAAGADHAGAAGADGTAAADTGGESAPTDLRRAPFAW